MFQDVRKRYRDVVALDGLDLDIRGGELLSLLGPNGAGKTTAISLLLGLRKPDSGSIRLFGGLPGQLGSRRGLGVMMQEESLPAELCVGEIIDLFSRYYPEPFPVEATLRMTSIVSLRHRRYGTLSGGQKRLVQFAVAICGKPKLLILDEPTVGLDIQARTALWAAIRKLVHDGVSIILTTHYLEEAEALADRVVVLSKGKIVAQGTVGEVRSIVVRKRISCVCSVPLSEVESWPGVEVANRDQDRLTITVFEAEDVVRRLLAADPGLKELEIQRAGLTEAFAKLTQEDPE